MSTLKEFKKEIFENYKEYVKEKAKKKDAEIFPNGTVEHAKVVIENLFEIAQRKINIFSGQLADVYESDVILENIKKFLEKSNSELKILLQDVEKNSKKLKKNAFVKLCEDFSEKCEIQTAAEDDKTRKNHFITVDGKSYRFEPNKKEKRAIACFNDKDFTKKIDGVFKAMFERAQK